MLYTLPITKARANLPNLVKNTQNKLTEYAITLNGVIAAYLVPPDLYDSSKETNEILADERLMNDIKIAEKQIAQGKIADWEDVKKELGLDV